MEQHDIPLIISEVARELGCTPATVRLMERRGELPAIRTSSGVRLFRRVDVERVKATRQQEQVRVA
jgi:excisionase family DNA binding protein